MSTHKNLLMIIISVMVIMAFSGSAFAASSATINVTVSIAAEASISVTGGAVGFSSMGVGASAVSTTPVVIKNNGSGGSETYSLSLVNPSVWTAVTTTPGAEQYRLSSAFDADGNLTWDPVNQALTAASQVSTTTRFAGDETGAGVPFNAERHLYFKIETPSTTSSVGQKTIQVVVTASVD